MREERAVEAARRVLRNLRDLERGSDQISRDCDEAADTIEALLSIAEGDNSVAAGAGPSDLLPCPFCGFDADLHHVAHWWVSCSNCEVNTCYEVTEAEARAAWNRRGGVQAAHEIIGDLLSMCDPSNWDADDGYRGLEYSIRHEVYERLHDFAAYWQQRIGALRAVERPADPRGWREAIEAASKVADEFDNSHNDGHPGLAGAIARTIRALSPAPKDREGG